MHDRSELDCKLEGLKFIAISPSSIVDFFGLDGMLLRSVALLGPSSIVDFFGLGCFFGVTLFNICFLYPSNKKRPQIYKISAICEKDD